MSPWLHMASSDTSPPLESMLGAFRERLRRGSPFAEDRQAAEELAAEASPALEALHAAWCEQPAEHADPLGHVHEAFALLTLLGRRAACMGVTPTATLAVSSAVREALQVGGVVLSEATCQALTVVCMEGYVAGREEAAAESRRAALVAAQCFLVPARGVVLWPAGGPLDATSLAHVGEEFARRVLREDGRACLVDLSGLGLPCAETAREVLLVASAVGSIGAACWVVAPPQWRDLLHAAGVEASGAQLCESSPAGLLAALASAGYAPPRRRRFGWLFGR